MDTANNEQDYTAIGCSIAVSDEQVIAVLTSKKSQLGALILDLEDKLSESRRELTAITETLKVFGVVEPPAPVLPNKIARRTTREGFRRGELSRRVLDKIRDAGKPASPADIGRAIMRECLMDTSDEKMYFAFQHKVCNVIRRQWQRGVLERVGGEDGFPARWIIAN